MAGCQPVLEGLMQRDDAAEALVLQGARGPDLCWSFAQLQAARRYCTAELRAAGLQPGDRVLLVCRDLPQLLALFFAALDLELCLLPLHPDQDPRSLQDIVLQQAPELAILDTAVQSLLAPLQALVPQCLLLNAAASAWLSRAQVPAATKAGACGSGGADRCAVVFHSSGSTGLPKALYYSRPQLDRFLHWQQRLFAPFDDEAPVLLEGCGDPQIPTPRLNALPLTHWGGLSFCLQALAEGRAVCLLHGFEADSVLELIERRSCRLLLLVPAMYRELLPRLQQRCPPSLRYCLTMGEAMPAGLAQELRQASGLLLCTAYGMSEALSGLAHGATPLEDVPHGSCGQQAFGELQLVGPDGAVQPATGAAEGELWVRNATTQPCYRDPALLQAKYADGWYRTGDCFRRDAAGHYYFRSRLDAMCVHNGRNVYPQQVEAVFIEHPGVEACVAAPIVLRDGRRRLGVYVVLAPGVDLAPGDLLDYYLLHGAHYAAPALVVPACGMPATWSGKPERAAIAALLQQASDAGHSGVNAVLPAAGMRRGPG